MHYFILGLFEGDGTFSFCKKTGKSETNLTCNPIIAKDLEIFFKEKLGIQVHYSKRKMGNGAVTLRFCGNEKMLKFFRYLYKNNKYKLTRKFNKFIEIYEYKKTLNGNKIEHFQCLEETEKFLKEINYVS